MARLCLLGGIVELHVSTGQTVPQGHVQVLPSFSIIQSAPVGETEVPPILQDSFVHRPCAAPLQRGKLHPGMMVAQHGLMWWERLGHHLVSFHTSSPSLE